MALADATVSAWLEQLAARTPAPGGGAAAAFAGATAAALTEMAAAFALERGEGEDVSIAALRARAQLLRIRLCELADADLRAYQPVLDALALGREDSGRTAALRAALSGASAVPLEIVLATGEVAELAAEIARAPGSRSLLGDAGTALALAEAATASAARLVELNLAGAPEDPRVGEAVELAARAAALRAELDSAA